MLPVLKISQAKVAAVPSVLILLLLSPGSKIHVTKADNVALHFLKNSFTLVSSVQVEGSALRCKHQLSSSEAEGKGCFSHCHCPI